MAAKPGVPLEGIDDFLLGLFGTIIPPCQRLDHAVRFFSTWSGSELVTQVIPMSFLSLTSTCSKLMMVHSIHPFPRTRIHPLIWQCCIAGAIWRQSPCTPDAGPSGNSVSRRKARKAPVSFKRRSFQVCNSLGHCATRVWILGFAFYISVTPQLTMR